MPHKRDGFVPLGDIAGTVELPGDRALTPAAPEARHHFTRLDQIDRLADCRDRDRRLHEPGLSETRDRRSCRRTVGPVGVPVVQRCGLGASCPRKPPASPA